MTSVPSTPRRHQRKRVKGWRMPEGVIYVGRPTKWGNPYDLNDLFERDATDLEKRRVTVNRFEMLAEWKQTDDPTWLEPLRGKDLACWCPLDKPCHADVLLELVRKRYGDAE